MNAWVLLPLAYFASVAFCFGYFYADDEALIPTKATKAADWFWSFLKRLIVCLFWVLWIWRKKPQ